MIKSTLKISIYRTADAQTPVILLAMAACIRVHSCDSGVADEIVPVMRHHASPLVGLDYHVDNVRIIYNVLSVAAASIATTH